MKRTCETFWGTHGCDLPAGHDGWHECDPEDCGDRIDKDGCDETGFQWETYGDDSPHPADDFR